MLEGLRAEAAKERAAAEELQKSGVDRELENQIRALQTELGKLQVRAWVGGMVGWKGGLGLG